MVFFNFLKKKRNSLSSRYIATNLSKQRDTMVEIIAKIGSRAKPHQRFVVNKQGRSWKLHYN